MKRILSLMLLVCFAMAVPASAERRMYPVNAGPDVNRVTWFNKVTDFVATVGKDKKAKKDIIRRRKNMRREVRLESHKRSSKAKTRNQMDRQQKRILDKINAKKKARYNL